MASKSAARTPNARLFATEADDATDSTQNKPRRVKNYMKSSIFGEEPAVAASPATPSASDMSDSGSETASNDGDRQVRAVPTTPTAAVQKPRTRVPPGGYSSPLW